MKSPGRIAALIILSVFAALAAAYLTACQSLSPAQQTQLRRDGKVALGIITKAAVEGTEAELLNAAQNSAR